MEMEPSNLNVQNTLNMIWFITLVTAQLISSTQGRTAQDFHIVWMTGMTHERLTKRHILMWLLCVLRSMCLGDVSGYDGNMNKLQENWEKTFSNFSLENQSCFALSWQKK